MVFKVIVFCVVAGLAVAAALRRGAYAPAPPGDRPPCASKRMTFCEEVDKYPTKLIQSLLRSKSFDVYDFFTDEREGLDEPPDYVLHQETPSAAPQQEKKRKARSVETNRSVNTHSGYCTPLNKTATPKMASNSNGEWRFIAQDEMTNLRQKFRVQLCNETDECLQTCTQFYSQVPMLAVEPSGDVEEDIFWLPSSCRCFEDLENTL